MKIALIIPGNIWFAPYVHNYTRILSKEGIDYQIISWNRDGKDPEEGIQYKETLYVNNGSAGLRPYLRYISFIKRVIKAQKFDKLIVFGPQMACLLGLFLLKNFRHRYMIDYRDLSIEQKIGLKQFYSILLRFSCVNVISSPGFKQCLPKREYYVSHNFDENVVRCAIREESVEKGFKVDGDIEVLTIGAIRDFSSNIEVTKALASQEGFTLRFVGRGKATTDKLKEYCDATGASNVTFIDSYNKPEEAGYVKSSTFMNIFYPRIITHDTALSNRFYNSLIYRKPMIVTKNTCQGDYAEKYNVGVALENCDNLTSVLSGFLEQDFSEYVYRCNSLLREFLKDQEDFESAVRSFVNEK